MEQTPKKEKIEVQLLDHDIQIGKDILELVTSAMYISPLTIYREYIQNSSDAIELAQKQKILNNISEGRIDININTTERILKIRDNGIGINKEEFSKILTSFGNSPKRGTNARGFRGIGRLAGLAYCQELIFRSSSNKDNVISEISWDCRKLKEKLLNAEDTSNLNEIVKSVITLNQYEKKDFPEHFFEIELKKIIRLKNDILLNVKEVKNYIAETGPVPFDPKFFLCKNISNFLDENLDIKKHNIFLNNSDEPIYKTFKNKFKFSSKIEDSIESVEPIKIYNSDNELVTAGFILHHNYLGAISKKTRITGIRVRCGNIQIGENNLFEELFQESRFNAWCIVELHVVNEKIKPNGRRDDFERSNQYYNFINHISPIAKRISDKCRKSSSERNQKEIVEHKEFLDKKKEKAFLSMVNRIKKIIQNNEDLIKIKKVIKDEINKI